MRIRGGHCAWLVMALVGMALASCGHPQRTVQTRAEGEPVVSVSGEDTEMNAAIAHARSTLDGFIANLQHPRPGQEAFTVKAAMKTDEGGVEHIWLSDVRYADGRFTGKLTDEPASIRARHKGDRVAVPRAEISDWAVVGKNGIEGAFTQKVLDKSGAQ